MSELPKGWTITDIQSIATDVVVGFVGTSKTHYRDSGIPFLTGKNIKNGKIDLRKIDHITNEFHQKETKSNLSPGDVVVVRIGRSGEAAVIPESLQDSNCGGLVVIKNPLAMLPELLSAYLNSPSAISSSQLEARGATRQTLNTKNIAEKKIPVPPLAEQTRIAQKLNELLAQVDTLKARIDAIPALLKRFRQSVLAAAVSGRLTEEWRAQNVDEFGGDELAAEHIDELAWPMVRLGDIARDFSYGSSAKSQPAGDIPVLRMGNIQGGRLDWSDLVFSSDKEEIRKYSLQANDILFNRTNSPELVGKTAIYKGERPAIYAGYLIRVRCSEHLSPNFLNYCLNSPQGRDYCWQVKTDGVSQSNINAKKLADFQLGLPSIEEQAEIVRRVEQLFAFADQLEAKVATAQARVDRLTQSILAKAFRGELVPQDPNDEPASVLLERIRAQRAAEPKAKRGRKASA